MGSTNKVDHEEQVEQSEYDWKRQDKFIKHLRTILVALHHVSWKYDCQYFEAQMEMTQKVVVTAAFGFGDINFHEFWYVWARLILTGWFGFCWVQLEMPWCQIINKDRIDLFELRISWQIKK